MVLAVDRETYIVHRGGQNDHHLGVLLGQPIVLHHTWLMPGLHQQAEHSKGVAGHYAHVRGAVVAETQAVYGVYVGRLPEGLDLLVGVDAVQQRGQSCIALDGHLERHTREMSLSID